MEQGYYRSLYRQQAWYEKTSYNERSYFRGSSICQKADRHHSGKLGEWEFRGYRAGSWDRDEQVQLKPETACYFPQDN